MKAELENLDESKFDKYDYYYRRNEAARKEGEVDFPSYTEKILDKLLGQELLTQNGRISILVTWTILTCVAAYGMSNLKV